MVNLAQVSATTAPVLTMQDELGITYLIDSAQQFWSGGLWVAKNPSFRIPDKFFARLFLSLSLSHHQSWRTSSYSRRMNHQHFRYWIPRYGDSSCCVRPITACIVFDNNLEQIRKLT